MERPVSENRRKILDCTLAAMANKGYEGVGIQEIVDAAGVTKPTLYHYFSSKKGLFEALLTEGSADLVESIERGCEWKGDLAVNLEELVRRISEFARDRASFYRLLMSLSFLPPESEVSELVRRTLSALVDPLVALFRSAEERHGNMAGRSVQFAVTFFAFVNATIAHAFERNLVLDADWRYKIVHQFMHGIFS